MAESSACTWDGEMQVNSALVLRDGLAFFSDPVLVISFWGLGFFFPPRLFICLLFLFGFFKFFFLVDRGSKYFSFQFLTCETRSMSWEVFFCLKVRFESK